MKTVKNILLVGMPGCGKSTLGVLLAKELGLDFVDTDIVIQNMTGELLQNTLEKVGVIGLLDAEEKAICTLDLTRPRVVSTGGSAVLFYGTGNYESVTYTLHNDTATADGYILKFNFIVICKKRRS